MANLSAVIFAGISKKENPEGYAPSGSPVIVKDKGAVQELGLHRLCHARRNF